MPGFIHLIHYVNEYVFHLKIAPIINGMASSWKVRVQPNLSARTPPVKEPIVAPASVELTTQPI